VTRKTFSELSPGMQRGLVKCETLVVEVADERHCGIAGNTLAALMRHGLVEETTDRRLRRVYRPTAAGTALLRADEPLWLHRRSQRGYTSRPAEAVLEAGEVIPPAVLEEYARDAAERRLGEPGRREEELRRRARSLATRLRQAALAADRVAPGGAAAHLDLLERQIAELERARERRAA